MTVSRYRYTDEYSKAELKAHLGSLAPQERIEFVKALPGFATRLRDPLTEALTEILTKDESVAVRAWAARTLGFDEFKNDAEPLVRAAWHESESLALFPLQRTEAIEAFAKLTSMERCAWVRNPTFPGVLLESLFDFENAELSLSRPERQWLILAFLSGARFPVGPARGSRYTETEGQLGDTLWEYIARWPQPFKRLRALVFEHVSASDEVRVKLLGQLKDRDSRHAIVRSAPASSEALRIALDDFDDDVRGQAWATYWFANSQAEWKRALEGYDLVALRALCRNKSFTATQRVTEFINRLDALGDDYGVSRELGLLSDKVNQERVEVESRTQSVEKQLRGLQESVTRTRFNVGILLLVGAVLMMVALVKSCS